MNKSNNSIVPLETNNVWASHYFVFLRDSTILRNLASDNISSSRRQIFRDNSLPCFRAAKT